MDNHFIRIKMETILEYVAAIITVLVMIVFYKLFHRRKKKD